MSDDETKVRELRERLWQHGADYSEIDNLIAAVREQVEAEARVKYLGGPRATQK
jgi:hypothetical protein